MAHLTVADVLALPMVRQARPQVLAGQDRLDSRIRWVHTTELIDIAGLLRGGELVLSTGLALPDDPDGAERFAASLTDVPVAGLMIELGRRWDRSLPPALVAACERVGLPLISLGREVRFAAVAQAVGERIVDDQLNELRLSEKIHETFTALTLGNALPLDILDATQRLASASVVLESEHHRVIDFVTAADDQDLLDDWYERSRRVATPERTAWDEDQGWLIARVGPRDRGWGRLILRLPTRPAHHLHVIAERAAAALALHRLHARDRNNALRRTHQELLMALLADPESPETHRRCQLAGVPLAGRQLVGITIRPVVRADRARSPLGTTADEVLATTLAAADEAGVPALVCVIDGDVRALLSVPRRSRESPIVDRIAARVSRRHEVVVGAGRSTDNPDWVNQTLRESQHVVVSVRESEAGPAVHRLEDTHVRGLLALFSDDVRMQTFCLRELASLDALEEPEREAMTSTLRALLAHPGSKSDAAAQMHLSRPAFYGRLAKLEQVLGRDLSDPETRTSLHLALLAREITATARPGVRGKDPA